RQLVGITHRAAMQHGWVRLLETETSPTEPGNDRIILRGGVHRLPSLKVDVMSNEELAVTIGVIGALVFVVFLSFTVLSAPRRPIERPAGPAGKDPTLSPELVLPVAFERPLGDQA